MFLYYKQLREQGWEPEVVICLQTDKQFLAFHFHFKLKQPLNNLQYMAFHCTCDVICTEKNQHILLYHRLQMSNCYKAVLQTGPSIQG